MLSEIAFVTLLPSAEQHRQRSLRLAFVKPLGVLERSDIGEFITAVIEYDQAGQFRRELSNKMLHGQMNLAQHGFSPRGQPSRIPTGSIPN
jgi:hypothetical protein